MIAYHASNKKFDKFSLEQANTQNHKENFKALWFSTDREYIKQFGKIIYKVNIDTKNFLRESQYNKIDKLVHEFDSTCDDGIGILETENGQKFADFLVSKGYDGYIFPQNDGKTIICFNPNVVTILSSIDETLTVYNGGATKEDSDGLKYYALDNLNEKLEELTDGVYATQSAYDILNLFKNKPKAYRVVYDKNNRYYFIGDALKYIHSDLISAAYHQGFYYDEFDRGSRDEIVIYLGNNLETQDILMLSFFPKDFGDIKAIDDDRSSDWYTHKYVYDFGTIYTQEACPLEEFDFYQLLGEPLEQEELEIPESLFISLNKELEKFLCD